MSVYFRCHSCREEHEFPVVVGRPAFEALTRDFRSAWARTWYLCPDRRSVVRISNADLFWKD